jgi:hypothetical protein
VSEHFLCVRNLNCFLNLLADKLFNDVVCNVEVTSLRNIFEDHEKQIDNNSSSNTYILFTIMFPQSYALLILHRQVCLHCSAQMFMSAHVFSRCH